jgi:flagellar basal body-associated protein FliL
MGYARLLIALAAMVAGIAPALASGAPAKKSGGHGEKAEAVPEIPFLKMPRLVAPLMVKGEMVRYVHFEVTFLLPDDSNKKMLMDKVPYIQDAFVRDVHGATILKNEETQEIDAAGLRGRLLAIVTRVAGPGIVKDIEFRDVSKDFH